MNILHTERKKWVPVIVPGLFIFLLCLLPGAAFPDVSWAAAFAPDKWVHAGLFAAWTLIWARSRRQPDWKVIAAATLMWGGFIELFQEYIVTWRSGEWLDWVADAAGIAAGAMLSRFLPATKSRN